MKRLGIAILNYLVDRTHALEEPGALYGISWEEQETRELACFIREATRELERRRADGAWASAPSTTVRITQGLRVFIGEEELRLRPMAKTVLLLFLRHPEGIPLKRIADYREELSAYYRKLSRSLEPGAIDRSIERILDCFSNDLNVNISRVNAAVRTLVADASAYQIAGAHGASKRIPLDRTLVLWE
ncbi:MAG: hypothetical protein IKI85_06790 [Bacteroidales bacterium]|jgi:hypothetical protein|nr:hypothetical protein [Bacteroidales bacterium]MBR3990233.1 hypothetical protein [Bacteroidales bacterium]